MIFVIFVQLEIKFFLSELEKSKMESGCPNTVLESGNTDAEDALMIKYLSFRFQK